MSKVTKEVPQKSIWAVVEKSYEIFEQIGQGGYGTVMKGKHITSGNLVAIKHMTNFCESKYCSLKVLREVSIMRRL